MTDCFSLSDAAELVQQLMEDVYFWREDDYMCDNAHAKTLEHAADAIEQLLAENAKLKAEMDAAVTDLEGSCGACKYEKHLCCNPFDESEEPCLSCDGSKWEWRGVKKEEEDGKIH